MKKRIFIALLIVFVLGFAFGPAPEKPKYDVSLPAMPSNLASLAAQVSKSESSSTIKPYNEAEITWANDSNPQKTAYALLYLPGFTATKMEGQPVYQNFARKYGMNCYAARLAGHGLITTDPLLHFNADTIWESAKEAFAIAKKLGQKVIIMSTSTGGTLALKLAATYGEDVFALINLSPNIRVKDPKAYLLNKPWGLQIARLVLGGDFRTVENVDTNYDKYWYKTYRIESLINLQELLETTMNQATFEAIDCPVLNLYYYGDEAHQDDVVDVERIIWMHKLLGTPGNLKREVAIADAGVHVIGCGLYAKDIPAVENAINSFASEVLALTDKPNP